MWWHSTAVVWISLYQSRALGYTFLTHTFEKAFEFSALFAGSHQTNLNNQIHGHWMVHLYEPVQSKIWTVLIRSIGKNRFVTEYLKCKTWCAKLLSMVRVQSFVYTMQAIIELNDVCVNMSIQRNPIRLFECWLTMFLRNVTSNPLFFHTANLKPFAGKPDHSCWCSCKWL